MARLKRKGWTLCWTRPNPLTTSTGTGGRVTYPTLDPVPRLVVTHPDFRGDAFVTNGNQTYVSKRLRERLGFPPEDVQYLQVDDSASSAEVRAADFRIMKVLNRLDGADRSKSVRNGLCGCVWGSTRRTASRSAHVFEKLVLRPDFDPSSRIFHVVGASEGPFVRANFDMSGITDMELRVPGTIYRGIALGDVYSHFTDLTQLVSVSRIGHGMLDLKVLRVSEAVQTRLYGLQDAGGGLIETQRLKPLLAQHQSKKSVYFSGGSVKYGPIEPKPHLVVTHPDFFCRGFRDQRQPHLCLEVLAIAAWVFRGGCAVYSGG